MNDDHDNDPGFIVAQALIGFALFLLAFSLVIAFGVVTGHH